MIDEERAARYSDLFEGRHLHSETCAYCPICATIAVVRNTRPELVEHLANAAREIILAAGIMLEEAGEVLGQPAAKRAAEDNPKVRRIDIG